MAVDESTMGEGVDAERLAGEQLGWASVFPHERPQVLAMTRPLVIGRGEHCDVQIPTATTSREHARIVKDGPLWIVKDLSSKNGVYVDGKRVSTARLCAGSLVRTGGGIGVVFEFRDGDESVGFEELAIGLYGGRSLAAVAERARLAARTELNLLLEAETGSGKERFARAIHDWSGRSGPFVAVNCAALPASLAEAELFGYQRGAFTGAERHHAGYFRAADGGTLFLDEMPELPPSVQAKLLRVVERKEVVPLGATSPIRVDTRIVAASQRPVRDAVASGQIRADLYARLNGLTIAIPPLRERKEDIPFLFRIFLQRAFRTRVPECSPALIESLCLHPWPLNVRELEAVVQRLRVLHADDAALSSAQLAAVMTEKLAPAPVSPAVARLGETEETWRKLVDTLTSNKGNVVRAAELVGISRQRANRMIAAHPEFKVSDLRRAAGARCNS